MLNQNEFNISFKQVVSWLYVTVLLSKTVPLVKIEPNLEPQLTYTLSPSILQYLKYSII